MAMVGSLTVLPALLSRLGDQGRPGPCPARRPAPPRPEARAASGARSSTASCGAPSLSVVVAGGLLVALAVPALQLRMVQSGPETFPQDLAVVKTYNRMQDAFPGSGLPANVVVKAADVNAPAVRDAIGRLKQQALASGRVHEPITVDVNDDATVANITLPIDGTGTDTASIAALGTLRDEVVPQTVGALPDAESGVTGVPAQWKDSTDHLKSTLPLVVAFVLVFAFGLMLVAFRSIVVAAKAIVLNLLSVAAAYGVLVIVFQHGFAQGLLGFGTTSGIDPVVPLLLFVILFGLSMDYHVLILSRIREAYDRGASMDEAISVGIKRTAGVVTSAALVMVGVFSIFADALDADVQAVRRRARDRDPDRRHDRPRRAPAGLDEAARRVELVPAGAGSSGCRGASGTRFPSTPSPCPRSDPHPAAVNPSPRHAEAVGDSGFGETIPASAA